MLYDDVLSLLVAANVGVQNTSIFLGPGAKLPAGDGPYLTINESGGTSPEHTHNSTTLPAYQRPSVQIVVTAKLYSVARLMAKNAYNALIVRNRTINSVWYKSIDPIQEPTSFGVDDVGRPRVSFNVQVIKRPS